MGERTWDAIWNDYYRPLTPEQAADWTAELRQQFRDLSGQELCRAVRWMAGRKGFKYPRLGDLVEAVNSIRSDEREKAGRNNDTREQFIDRANVDAAEQAMTLAIDHEERWDVLCTTCHTVEECDVVNQWAATQWPDWKQYVTDIQHWIARSIGRTAKEIGREMEKKGGER